MSFKNDRTFYLLLVKIYIVLSAVGLGALIYTSTQTNPSNLAFSVIAFVISVAALVMTTLQSLSIARQVRITEKAARIVQATSEELGHLLKEDRKLEKEIRQDIVLDHEIIAVLEEFGIGDNEDDRRNVAQRISKRVTK